jgi:hypothetical protein
LHSLAESLGSAGFCARRLFLAIFWGCVRFKRSKKPACDSGDVIDCCLESRLVRLGWDVKAANLSDKLERCRANFFVSGWRLKVEKHLNTSAHLVLFPFTRPFWYILAYNGSL